ncbi:MAG: ferredoxin [Pseudobdellovibrionaceae bacterium]
MNEGYKAHLFICTNSPDKEGKCGFQGSDELRKQLKERCRLEFGKSVRVNSAGCLGFCERGIAAVIYPQNQWLLDLSKDDGEKIFAELKKLMG